MKLKNITFKEYFKVVGVSLAVPGFSWFIIWFEWQNADAGGRIAGPTLTILVHLSIAPNFLNTAVHVLPSQN